MRSIVRAGGPVWLRRAVFPALAAGMVVAIAAPGAQAVHDVGAFQLDGDARRSVPNASAVTEDWDQICLANPTTCTFAPGYDTSGLGATTAVASSHVDDGGLAATIFHGGGSKDIYDVSSWRWKNDSGGLPDKDNLLHAMAARYSLPKSAECPAPASATTCEVIFFGSDRYANDGDAQQAFWFFQNPITQSNESANGGFRFNGVHRNGDLLIVSDFSNGGTKSTINVYKWMDGSLVFLAGGDDVPQLCGGSSPDAFCGIVNPDDGTTAPWTFLDKKGNTSFAQGEFFEAGINLSDPAINLADECFSSFVAETRSSTSTTATLKDFVLGQFAPCSASMTTVPSAGAGGIVSPGEQVTDTATVTGSGSASPPTPTGTVTFYLCGPIATGVCSSGGTLVGTGTLSGSGATATATSPAVNTNIAGLTVGRYCFRAEWPGDTNYTTSLSHTGTGDQECFYVRDTTSITTAQDWLPNDSATITSAGGSALNGSVAFSLYNTSLADCQAGGSTGRIYSQTVNLATNAASPATVSTSNTTVRVSASTTVWWRVVFTSTNSGVLGITSNCTERTVLTITN